MFLNFFMKASGADRNIIWCMSSETENYQELNL